jgi:hypothetical protein
VVNASPSLLTGGPPRSSITLVQGLLRLVVVAFTVISLLVVAAAGVAAGAGKQGSANAATHSVVAVFSGHFEQLGIEGIQGGSITSAERGSHSGGQGDDCRPHKKHHHHATGDHENNECGGDDSGSD